MPPELAHDRRGHGPPLVLLHPLGADRRAWDPVLPWLEHERDVIAVDLPGFGDSPPLRDGEPDPARLAAAVAELVAGLGLRDDHTTPQVHDGLQVHDGPRVHMAGNSLGGWVALELAAAGQAASVTAIAPAGLWARPLGPRPEVARWAARAARPGLVAAMRSQRMRRLALAGAVAAPERVPPAQAAALVRAYANAPGFSAVNRAMRAGVFAHLAELEVPVTLAWPEHDRLIARPSRVPGGVREVVLRGCGHMPMWDDPQQVAHVLLTGSESREATSA